MKISVLASAIALLSTERAMACTTILVGDKASDDGSFMVARSEDHSATNARHMVVHPAEENHQGEFKSHSSNFIWPLPKSTMRYIAIHDFDTQDKSTGEVGFNSAGAGMSSTETIYNGKTALAEDPSIGKTSITEDAIQTVILQEAKSVREGAALPGKSLNITAAVAEF